MSNFRSYLLSFSLILVLGACGGDQNNVSKNIVPKKATGTGWELISPSISGVDFNNRVPEDYNHYFIYFNYVYNGGGIGVGDLDNDGLPDLYFAGNRVQDRVYKNKGDLQFEDVTEQANLILDNGWNSGVTMVDINADGLLDIYVTRGAWEEDEFKSNLLYVNQGDFRFEEMAEEYGLADEGFSVHANFFDYDSDGDLDAYVLNRSNKWALNLDELTNQKNEPEEGASDRLYRNDNGKFVDVSEEAGIVNFAFGLSAVTLDVNNDNKLDLYVANDFIENDFLYVNQGDGTFKDEIRKYTNHNPFFSMGTDIQDINNDGFEDIYTVEMLPEDYFRSKVTMFNMLDADRFDYLFNLGKFHHQYMHNNLQLNQGNGHFSEISAYAGVKSTDWSWATLLSDFDHDGLKDIFVANGFKRDVYDRDRVPVLRDTVNYFVDKYRNHDSMPPLKDLLEIVPSVKLKNRIFKNTGNLKFESANDLWGMQKPSFSNGAAVADLDLDGDLDIVTNNIDDPAFIYRNDFANGNYLRVKLQGPKQNPNGLGALVEIKSGDQKFVERSKMVRGYLSSVEPILHFGLGNIQDVDEVRVTWLDGRVTLLKGIDVNQEISVAHKAAHSERWDRDKITNTLFADVTEDVIEGEWRHQENFFKDFRRQILLPHRQSMHGPAMAVGDVNGDGLEDVFIGGAYEKPGQLFIQNSAGKLVPRKSELIEGDERFEDVGAVFADIDGDGDKDLYVVSGGMEYNIQSDGYQDRLYINDGQGNFTTTMTLPEMNISGSVATATDIDKDNMAEIFIGGRVLPFFYPEPVSSIALKNFNGVMRNMQGGSFTDLDTLGMVTDARWVDLDGNGLDELVIVGEWMPITIFQYDNGKYRNVTEKYGLDDTNGWWFSVEKADLDGDGDQDLIVGNIGLNHKFNASKKKPFEAYADDFDGNGSYDLFLAKHLGDKLVPIRGRDCTSEQMPDIADRLPTFRDFAEQDLSGVIGRDLSQSRHVVAYEFRSLILENKNGRFVQHELPKEAQFSALRGIIVDDFDGDEIKDLIIAGNMFPTEAETTRADASIGLYLKGQGNFTYTAVGPRESGISLPYDVRHIKPILLGSNKKRAFIVAINNQAPKVYQLNK